ncbi:hypothetical protein KC685_04995 [Candidatus Dojkabacteria bacterium]|uniref:Uncharacterized protein n=1 Tax=Candidatus Dojkabacteria bacterium TaxID=2099670 RepID=A0A955I1E1_9BACT|nr:hypothetical protein [Candidatus Dojkabacteria bacterium]
MDNENKDSATSDLEFLESLHEEKLKHKEHRVQFVKQKLLFTIGLFSIGALKQINLGGSNVELSDLLLFVPIVALAFDIYIFAEDFKVKRIGIYIFEKCNPSKAEKNWEDWLSQPKHREKTALFASVMLTVVALIASFLVLQSFAASVNMKSSNLLSNNTENIFWWFLISAASISLIFEATIYARDALVAPLRNRLNLKKLVLGLVFTASILAYIFASKIDCNAYDWNNHDPSITLIVGSITAAWLFMIQRMRREFVWRYKGRFSLVKFEFHPKFKNEDTKVIAEAYLCGDFTRWAVNKIKMKSDGSGFECTVALESGKEYQYKYLTIDNDNMEYWFNNFGEEKIIFNEGWNTNDKKKVRYTEYPTIKGVYKFFRDLYS